MNRLSLATAFVTLFFLACSGTDNVTITGGQPAGAAGNGHAGSVQGGSGGSVGGSGGSVGGSGGSVGGSGGSVGGSGGSVGGSGGSVGGSGGSVGGSGGSTVVPCGVKTKIPACTDCMHKKCETECKIFEDTPNRADYMQCINSCSDNDTTCFGACRNSFPDAAKTLYQLRSCLEQQCNSACMTSGSNCSLSTNNPTCDQCMLNKCPTSCANLESAPNSSEFLNCFNHCANDTCYQSCSNKYPAASQALDALFTCLDNKCQSACSDGGNN